MLVQSIGSLQKKYSIGSFELLSKTAPIQAASLLVLGPFVDYFLSEKLILEYKYSSGAIVSLYEQHNSFILTSSILFLKNERKALHTFTHLLKIYLHDKRVLDY